jgi:hypothetical protein
VTTRAAIRKRRWKERRVAKGLPSHLPRTGDRGGYDGFIAFDGEGATIDGMHRYLLLCAADDNDRHWTLRNLSGIATEEAFNFLVNIIPKAGIKVGFALGYDWAKILTDVPREALKLLVHPEYRLNKAGDAKPIYWRHWKLNQQGMRMSITDLHTLRTITCWDCFKFFQTSFLNALAQWQIAPAERLAFIAAMKDARSEFADADWSPGGEVERYCIEECSLLAQMMREVRNASRDAGFPLRSWHGAGSIAGVMLTKESVVDHIAPHPEKVDEAVRCAFFGGRFETSRIGTISQPIYGYDINSAYPHALRDLPSLVGKWVRGPSTRRSLLAVNPRERYVVAYVSWEVSRLAWAPFPIRMKDGTIIFPTRGQGWYWLDEVQAACRLFGEKLISLRETWEFIPNEPSLRPQSDINRLYEVRLAWGKSGRGLVVKLGLNARYGKAAQRVGKPRWSSMTWAGMITARTRGMLLDAMAQARSLDNILMVATDGIWSLEQLNVPIGKQLGDWDSTVYERGAFLARPGIYFPLDPRDREEQWEKVVKSRGISRRLMRDHADEMVAAWEAGASGIQLSQRRFVGIRSGLRGPTKDDVAAGHEGKLRLGEWIDDQPVHLSFDPRPKRFANADRSRPHVIDPLLPFVSSPYDPKVSSPETESLREAMMIYLEQPDGEDMVDSDAIPF